MLGVHGGIGHRVTRCASLVDERRDLVGKQGLEVARGGGEEPHAGRGGSRGRRYREGRSWRHASTRPPRERCGAGHRGAAAFAAAHGSAPAPTSSPLSEGRHPRAAGRPLPPPRCPVENGRACHVSRPCESSGGHVVNTHTPPTQAHASTSRRRRAAALLVAPLAALTLLALALIGPEPVVAAAADGAVFKLFGDTDPHLPLSDVQQLMLEAKGARGRAAVRLSGRGGRRGRRDACGSVELAAAAHLARRGRRPHPRGRLPDQEPGATGAVVLVRTGDHPRSSRPGRLRHHPDQGRRRARHDHRRHAVVGRLHADGLSHGRRHERSPVAQLLRPQGGPLPAHRPRRPAVQGQPGGDHLQLQLAGDRQRVDRPRARATSSAATRPTARSSTGSTSAATRAPAPTRCTKTRSPGPAAASRGRRACRRTRARAAGRSSGS